MTTSALRKIDTLSDRQAGALETESNATESQFDEAHAEDLWRQVLARSRHIARLTVDPDRKRGFEEKRKVDAEAFDLGFLRAQHVWRVCLSQKDVSLFQSLKSFRDEFGATAGSGFAAFFECLLTGRNT